MEPSKISSFQLFVLIVLFELGSALILPIGIEAKQSAWIAILLSTFLGIILALIYIRLYLYFPEKSPIEYFQSLLTSPVGKALGLLYILYFLFLTARVVRDFGEMLVIIAYPETPLLVINTLWLMLVIYTTRKGIEVLARSAEILFFFIALLAFTSFILILITGDVSLSNTKPLFEINPQQFFTAVIHTTFFPFGELIAFTMIFPYLAKKNRARKVSFFSISLAGIILSVTTLLNLCVLGLNLVERSLFPLLTTIQKINLSDFLERLDVFFIIGVIICGFIKMSIFFYVSIIGTASLFNVRDSAAIVYPMGFVTLLLSIAVSSNVSQHFIESTSTAKMFIHLPFEIIIPIMLLLIAVIRKKIRQ